MLRPLSHQLDVRPSAHALSRQPRLRPALKDVSSSTSHVAIAGLLAMATLLCGCANDVLAHDPGDYHFRGTWRETSRIGTATVWGREYSASFRFGQREEIMFTSPEGDPIVCAPNPPAHRMMTGSCTVKGKPAYRFELVQGYTNVPWTFTLSPSEKRAYKSYKGRFSILTHELSLVVDRVLYAGKINGRLLGPGDTGEGILHSADGKSMPCYLVISPVGGGYGYCAPYPSIRYNLFWRQGSHP